MGGAALPQLLIVITMRKFLVFSVALFCIFNAAGCSSDPRISTGQNIDTSAAGTSDTAKQGIKNGEDNSRITQQVMKTRRLPNGQPLPSASNPVMQPPGFHG